MSPIRVQCIFPDSSTADVYVSEIGEFLRLTKLVNGITMEGINYVFYSKFVSIMITSTYKKNP